MRLMNRILFISDLHLADTRNRPGRDKSLLAELASLIRRRGCSAVVNLGDTVSREDFRPEGVNGRETFQEYLCWRDTLGIPFRECSIFRERAFFRSLFNQAEDSTWTGLPGVAVLTFSPNHEDDHTATADQWEWISREVSKTHDRIAVIASHVPYPGTCSRPITPGIYLPVPDTLRRQLESRELPVFWAAGHFHWAEEPPAVFGSLTAFMGGRILIDSMPEKTTYLRELDLDTLTITTLKAPFEETVL